MRIMHNEMMTFVIVNCCSSILLVEPTLSTVQRMVTEGVTALVISKHGLTAYTGLRLKIFVPS